MITQEKFYKKMKFIEAYFSNDAERKHIAMDNLMCYVLTQLGYGDGVKVFKERNAEMSRYYMVEYLIGGYGSFGKIIKDSGYANNFIDYLNTFWKRHGGVLDCVKPVILHLYEDDKKIELTYKQKHGK